MKMSENVDLAESQIPINQLLAISYQSYQVILFNFSPI